MTGIKVKVNLLISFFFTRSPIIEKSIMQVSRYPFSMITVMIIIMIIKKIYNDYGVIMMMIMMLMMMTLSMTMILMMMIMKMKMMRI